MVDHKRNILDYSLKEILDGIIVSQRKDIKDFSSGHLNESNLIKFGDRGSHSTWKSAQKSKQLVLPRVNCNNHKKEKTKDVDSKMLSTLLDFSLGASGPYSVGGKQTNDGSELISTHHDVTPVTDFTTASKDGIYVEEIPTTEACLETPRRVETEKDIIKHQLLVSSSTEPDQLTMKHCLMKGAHFLQNKQYIRSHLEGVTKQDQLRHLKYFDSDIVCRQDMLETHIFSGKKTVEELENSLKKDLAALDYLGNVPNFYQLQVYSRSFNDVIDSTKTFKFILRRIKFAYDNYIENLLDTQTLKHKHLYDQVEQLESNRLSKRDSLSQLIQETSTAEEIVKEKIKANKRLTEELSFEDELLYKAKQEPVQTQVKFRKKEPARDVSEKINSLHTSITQKLNEMKELRNQLRKQFVPSTVITHLEQCVKETDIEIQKLSSAKAFYEKSIGDLENELRNAITSADTTEKDAKRVWKRVNAIHKGSSDMLIMDELDEDEDDRSKWEWYIS